MSSDPITLADVRAELARLDAYARTGLDDMESRHREHLRVALAAVDALGQRLEDMIVRDACGQHVSQQTFNGLVGGLIRERDAARVCLAEAEATLANEKGEGEGPSKRWKWWGFRWEGGLWSVRRHGGRWIGMRDKEELLDLETARDVMRAADEADDEWEARDGRCLTPPIEPPKPPHPG